MYGREIVDWSRKLRSKYLDRIGQRISEKGITANQITSASFLFGLAAFYFLFQNHLWFVIFASLHLLADGLDGIVARSVGETLFGKYFDLISDGLIAFLLILRIYFYLDDYFVLVVLGLLIINYLIFFSSNFKSPAIFVRTGAVIVLLFAPLFPIRTLLTASYLIGGVLVLYNLLLQLRWFLDR